MSKSPESPDSEISDPSEQSPQTPTALDFPYLLITVQEFVSLICSNTPISTIIAKAGPPATYHIPRGLLQWNYTNSNIAARIAIDLFNRKDFIFDYAPLGRKNQTIVRVNGKSVSFSNDNGALVFGIPVYVRDGRATMEYCSLDVANTWDVLDMVELRFLRGEHARRMNGEMQERKDDLGISDVLFSNAFT